jgi:phosphoserine phosphatase
MVNPVTGASSDASASAPVPQHVAPVICVDLDGTLIATDTLWESLLSILLRRPASLFGAVSALSGGKAAFKCAVSRSASVDASRLPYRQELLKYLRQQKAAGRSLVLVTAAHESLAKSVCDHFPGLFNEYFASNEHRNLRGAAKAALLVERYGPGKYVYAGNDATDLHVWKDAGAAIAVSAPESVVARIPVAVEREFRDSASPMHVVAEVIRMRNWVPNLLVFVPLFTSRDLLNADVWLNLAGAMVALSLTDTGRYLIGDLMTLESDRVHPQKRLRPLASGDLPIPAGLALATCLVVTGGLIGAVVGRTVLVALLTAYLISSLLYGKALQSNAHLGVFALAGLYVFRVVIGGFVSNHQATVWLLTFFYLCFLIAGFLKRLR